VRHRDNAGTLYKLALKVRPSDPIRRHLGTLAPGDCAIRVEWKHKGEQLHDKLAKWDEAPNPFQGGKFSREMVPQGYFQPLFVDVKYTVPILMCDHPGEKGEQWTVFTGWWFSRLERDRPAIARGDPITIRIAGTGLSWHSEVKWHDILAAKPDDREHKALPSLYGEENVVPADGSRMSKDR